MNYGLVNITFTWLWWCSANNLQNMFVNCMEFLVTKLIETCQHHAHLFHLCAPLSVPHRSQKQRQGPLWLMVKQICPRLPARGGQPPADPPVSVTGVWLALIFCHSSKISRGWKQGHCSGKLISVNLEALYQQLMTKVLYQQMKKKKEKKKVSVLLERLLPPTLTESLGWSQKSLGVLLSTSVKFPKRKHCLKNTQLFQFSLIQFS